VPRSVCAVRRFGATTALVIALTALFAGVAQGGLVHVGGRTYGVMPAPAAQTSPFASAQATPLTSGSGPGPVTYSGGPLMLSSTLYLIFWGPRNDFPASYTDPIVQFAKDLHADEGKSTDDFSVTELYANGNNEHISGQVSLGGEAFDTTLYPTPEKSGGCERSNCLTNPQIETEIASQIAAHHWPADPEQEPRTQYLLYTPAGVTVCLGPERCTLHLTGLFEAKGFCAYHSWLYPGSPGDVAIYSVLPDVNLCDRGGPPAGLNGTLNEEIHETIESATDPEYGGYRDEEGNEVADKCVHPLVSAFPADFTPLLEGTPGEGLFGSPSGNAYNQLIDGNKYYLQDMWSNELGCVPRIGPTPSFTAPASSQPGETVSFNAGGSFDLSGALTTYEWNYGDGSATETTSEAKAEHVYPKPGAYQVSLKVSDASGPANASTQTRAIDVTTSQTETVSTTSTTSVTTTTSSTSTTTSQSGGAQEPGPVWSSQGTETSTTVSLPPPPPGSGAGRPPTGAKPAPLSRTERLDRAVEACLRLTKRRRIRCIAAARKRFAPPPERHKTTRSSAKRGG
jgi:PKD repeat protein